MLGQLHRAAQPLGVGHQADLHEHAFQLDPPGLASGSVRVVQAVELASRAGELGRLRLRQDHHVGQAFQLLDQHRVGTQRVAEFQQRHVGHDAGQVDRRLDAGVAAADHRHPLALEQRPVTVRAVGHALVLVFLLAGHVDIAPARARGNDDRPALERPAIGQLHLDQAARRRRRHQLVGALQVHHVDAVILDVRLQRHRELRAVGRQHGDVVLDRQRVVDLAAEALGRDAGADALAGGVHRRRGASGTAADDQHVVRVLGRQLGRVLGRRAGVQLGGDLLDRHAARAELLAVQVDRRDGHDLAGIDLVLEQRAVDDHRLDARIQHRHQRQRLHDVRAVVAGQGHVDLEGVVAVQALDLVDHGLLDLGRVAAGPQQRQHQRGELMAQRDAGEAQALLGARALEAERGLARIVAVQAQRDLVGHRGDVLKQLLQLGGARGVAQGGFDLERQRHPLQVGLELRLQVVVQHRCFLSNCFKRLRELAPLAG